MSHLDHLSSLIDLQDLAMVDVGAGDGKFARAFARRGAHVIGIEIDDEKVARAKQAAHPHVEIRLGQGENLPIDDASADLICFMFSFHHIPQDVQEASLFEAQRVLKPAGRMHIVEPSPQGSMTEAMIDLVDESHVLNCSQQRLDQLAEGSVFSRMSHEQYVIPFRTPDFDTFLNGIIAVDPKRAEKLPAVRSNLDTAFHRVAEKTDDGFTLKQPCIAHHFEKLPPA